MSIDMIQLLYYAGFAVLGWWLRHRGIALPSAPALPAPGPQPAPAPNNQPDPRALVDLLKSLIDRLAVPAAPSPANTGNVVHVPIEVAANVKQPQA
jgi:hypothetical protein